jgi:hypothetical protein
LWPIAVIAAGVFLLAYILDWDSVTALMWACLAGQFGLLVSIISFGVLFLLGSGAALLWRRPMPAPAAKAPRKARRPPAQPKKSAQAEPEEAIPPDTQRVAVDVREKRPSKPTVSS